MPEQFYELYIILNDVPMQIIVDGTCNQEEAIDFITKMNHLDYVDYISTTQGILSYNVKNVKSVFYIAKPIAN